LSTTRLSYQIAKEQLYKYINDNLFFKLDDKERIKLSSGKLSNYYFDVRSISSSWYYSKLISYCYENVIDKYDGSQDVLSVGGLETGAIPIIMSLVHEYQINGFYVRKERKKHGKGNVIEGVPSPDVVLVDDVISTGKGIIKCIDDIKKYNHNITIKGVFPLIDRNKEIENFDLFFQLKSRDILYEPIFSSLDFISPQKKFEYYKKTI
jgi:orotate phosphoribosyltransferase